MFGMGFFEIFMVIVVAIIFLGPDKLPQAMVDLAKFFKAVKKTLDDAKTSLDKELNLEELKKEALEYKNSFTQSLDEINKETALDSLNSILDENPKPQKDLQEQLNLQSLKDKEEMQKASKESKTHQEISLSNQPQEISYKNKES